MRLNFRGAVRVAAILCAASSMAACATVTRGVHEKWTVETDPDGATVKTSNGFTCQKTPCTFTIERKAEFDVTVTKDGYKPFNGRVNSSVSKAGATGMVGNVLIGGIIGVGVDATSGAMNDLKPNPMKITLEKTDSTEESRLAPAPAPAEKSATKPASKP